MNLMLFHYVHCPFCIRVRMALGHLKLPYTSKVLSYDDETTPVKLTGVKMLPILTRDGKAQNESLDIIGAIDERNFFKTKEIQVSQDFENFNSLLNRLGKNVHNLAMPYWVWTPEFNDSSRRFFQKKKEAKRGPFRNLVKNKDQYSAELQQDLAEVAKDLKPFYRSESFSLYDILLASHLWGLYVVPEFQFPEDFHRYLQKVKELCEFNYHEDFWN
ncbi:MAG: glutaredoxin 2 [Bacteriovoracia bacterium]